MAQPFDVSRLSHSYIVCASAPEQARRAARDMAAAALCAEPMHAPCGRCKSCRKVLDGIHPDVITVSRPVDDKGRQKREISVDQVREMNADACVLPNEAARKVYIVDEADCMNRSAQNAALKLLEEPPNGAVFFLCVTNPSELLPTVRSRCIEISCAAEKPQEDPELEKLALAYLRTVASGDKGKLFAWCTVGENMDTRAAAEFFDVLGRVIADVLCARRSLPSLSARQLMHLAALNARCRDYLKVNTGVKHIFGLLAVDSIDGSGK